MRSPFERYYLSVDLQTKTATFQSGLANAARSVQEEVLKTFMDALTEGLEDMKS